MKRIFLCLLITLTMVGCNHNVESTQDSTLIVSSTDSIQTTTKMERFTSRTGTLIRFVDTNLPELKTIYSLAENRIRHVTSGKETAYFYQIEKKGNYSNKVASIEYTDLLEVNKALAVLKEEVETDKLTKPDYMENKFVTVDGFQVGYYIIKEKIVWFLTLEKYGSDNSLFISDFVIIQKAFNEAKQKIEELKGK